jgi:type IV pilus assembly protein PilO
MGNLVETFNKIPGPQRLLILVLVMGLLCVLFYLFGWSALEDDIKSQKDRRLALLTQETDIKRKVANRDEIMGELDDLKTRKAQVEKVLPASAEISKLLQKIYGQAKIVGLEIRRFEPGNETVKKLYAEIPVSIEVRGTYDQIADFFFYVGKMERIVNIKNISIERLGGGAYGTGPLRVTCDAITYRSVLAALTGPKK